MSMMGDRLILIRAKKYRSKAEAARRLKVPYPTYAGHENGNREFDADAAKKYAKHFGVNWVWLHTGVGAPDGSDKPYVLQVFEEIDPSKQPDAISYLEFLRGK